MAELDHQGHVQGDKQEETFLKRFTMGLVSLLSSLPLSAQLILDR